MKRQRLRVAIVFGGPSSEHEVSIRSADSVLRAIDKSRFEPVLIGVTHTGSFTLVLPEVLRRLPNEIVESQSLVPIWPLLRPQERRDTGSLREAGDEADQASAPGPIDVVFPLMHGQRGEDGCLQGLLEFAGIPHVGSSVLGSALAMDKATARALLEHAGLPVTKSVLITRWEWERDREGVLSRCAQAIELPWFVKPCSLGSSVGVSKVREASEMRMAIDAAAAYDRRILVERAVPSAREIEVAVLGNDDPVASVAGEIIPDREFYDYESKYRSAATQLIVPAELPAQAAERVRAYTLAAFRALECRGYARVDFLLSRESGDLFVSEVNTVPGFTSVSMFPKLWEASGMSYRDLITRMVELALQHHEDAARNRIGP